MLTELIRPYGEHPPNEIQSTEYKKVPLEAQVVLTDLVRPYGERPTNEIQSTEYKKKLLLEAQSMLTAPIRSHEERI
jgi:hypothetical protein